MQSLTPVCSYNHLIDGDLNILLVVVQAVVAILCVEICKYMRWVEYPNFNMRTARYVTRQDYIARWLMFRTCINIQ